MRDSLRAAGVFSFRCLNPDGELLWQRDIYNIVATVGKNLAFNTFLNGANYTVTGPYLGLIASQSFGGVAASDTMASHPGWQEAGGIIPPTYSGSRALCAWAPANNGAIGLVAPASFSITASGSVQGAFIVFGPSAVNTIGSTGGVLWSAGVFSGGAASITTGFTMTVNYAVSM